jgi:prephenate dehydrogenase
MSSYDLWRDIIDTNRDEILRALDAYIATLGSLRNDFQAEFEKASAFAKKLRA